METTGDLPATFLWLIHHCLSEMSNIIKQSCWLTLSGIHHILGLLDRESFTIVRARMKFSSITGMFKIMPAEDDFGP